MGVTEILPNSALQSCCPGTYVVGSIMSMRLSPLPAVILVALVGLSGCEDVRSWRMRQNDQIGTYVPPRDEYCYRSIADVTCYTQPDEREAARRVQ